MFDRFNLSGKSWLYQGARRLRSSPVLKRSRAFQGVQNLIETVNPWQLCVSEQVLQRVVAVIPLFNVVSVSITEQGIGVDAELESAERCSFLLKPVRITFAPGGAKEIVWRTFPEIPHMNSATRSAASAAVAKIAGYLALRLWNLPMPSPKDLPDLHPAVEAQQLGFVTDLSVLPIGNQALTYIKEVLVLREILLSPRKLYLRRSLLAMLDGQTRSK